MPQVLRPRQPEAPKQPERPKPPEHPKPPEMPKPETVKRPDPPKRPEAPTDTQDGLLSRFGKHWKEMSIFARIMFTIGLFGAVFYGIKLARVAVGTAEFETDWIPAWIYFLYFLLMVSELFQLLRYEGFAFRGLLGTVWASVPGWIGGWLMLFCFCFWELYAFILPLTAVNGRDGVVFAWGGLACFFFQFIWLWARACGCPDLKEEKSERK